ncbi:adenylate/guanylate cyclase domain-containing protein [Novosphingobium flavum]|uniref:adenylate/guanylate cyclase domain-containing protein n=1 Tax=Novosphingobium flavum TaxID=1778672 RepID=UPI0031B5716C
MTPAITGASRRVLARGARNLRAAGPRRLAIMAVILLAALALAALSWRLPGVGDAERSLYDLRAYLTAPRVEQDPRVLLVVYDDQTLIAAKKRSPLDRGLLAKALRNLDAMGAKAVGIDILFDQPQDEDDDLVGALRGMKTPTFIAYADVAGNRSDIVYDQQQYLDAFRGRLAGSTSGAASIRLDFANGATRLWPLVESRLPPVLGRAMLAAGGDRAAVDRFAGYRGAVRYRLPVSEDRPVWQSLKIDLFADPEIAAAMADQVRGKYVLIGGDIVDVDRVPTTFTAIDGDAVPGLQVHAAMIAQMLDRAALPRLSGAMLALLAVLVVVSAGLTSLLEWKPWRLVPFIAVQLALFGGAPVWLQWRGVDTFGVPAVGWALAWIVAFAAVSSAARASTAEQRRFAHDALGKYLPRDIAEEIIEHPELLALHGEKKALFIVFSDLEGFTQMSHSLEPEQVARLLNQYLEMLSKVVLDHGGVIDKFVGDAVVAFWGAPLARDDDGRRAALAAYAMWQAGEEFRRLNADAGLPRIGKTRVGMHYGEAVVGNFGGERRIQYTALGDAMNTAARLESANKALGSSVMASRELAERSGLDWWRPMGSVVLRGRAKPVELFEPRPDFPVAEREALGEALALHAADPARGIEALKAVAARHPADEALQKLIERYDVQEEVTSHVLG